MWPRLTAILWLFGVPALLPAEDLIVPDCEVRWRRQVTLASDRPGLLAEVPFEEGDLVPAGALVVRLDDRVLLARLAVTRKEAEGRNAIEATQKAQLVAQAEYDKAVEANRQLEEVIPELELKRLKFRTEQTQLEYQQAIYERELKAITVKQVEAELETTRILAPFGGMVTKSVKSVGEAVQQGEEILQITSLDRLRVEGYVRLSEAARLQRKQLVYAEVDGRRFEGQLQFIDVNVQPLQSRVLIWAELKNTDQYLRAGQRISLIIPPAEQRVNTTGPANE